MNNILFLENQDQLSVKRQTSCIFWLQATETWCESRISRLNFVEKLDAIYRFWNISSEKHMDRVKRIWYLSPMRAAKVQASLRMRADSSEPPLLAHTSSDSRGTFRQKARSLASLNGWACAVKICHDGMLEDTNSLDGAHISFENIECHTQIHVWLKIKLHSKWCRGIIRRK